MFKPEDDAPTAEGTPASIERRLTVTPLDLRQARFSTAMRGFDRTEVTTLVAEAAESFERAVRENERLRQEVARLEATVSQFRELEGSLTNTLMTAQKVADDMRENAAQESARVLREAEGRAEMAREKAKARLDDLEREIDTLRMRRREAETTIEATISTLQSSLDFIREQGRRDRDDRVHPLRPAIEIASRPA